MALDANLEIGRRAVLGLIGASVAGAGLSGTGWAKAAGGAAHPLLATPDQLAAERLILRLEQDAEVKALQARLVAQLLGTNIGRTPAGAATVNRAVAQWTRSLAFHEMTQHRRRPAVLWVTDDTPHSWMGYTMGGVGASGDNPDNIYRGATIDGTRNYEVLGWIDKANPAEQLVIQIDRIDSVNPASMFDMNSKMPSVVSATLGLLSNNDLKIAPDGSFRITLGSGEQGPVHVPLKPGKISVGTRDLLADWRQRPCKLMVRELGAPPPPAETEVLDAALIKQQLLADLPGYAGFWGKFPEIWFGGLKPNQISAPRGRVGGWGFVAGLNFALAPDEAAIVTTTKGQAVYTGFQVNDPWMIQPDAKRHQVCLNSSQAKPDADGSFTYVISRTDTGHANWIDTDGIDSGMAVLRWQKVPAGMTGDGLIREYKVVKKADLEKRSDLPRVTPAQRRAEIAKRAADYASRAA